MAVRIHTSVITATPSNIIIDIDGKFGTKFSALYKDDFGGATIIVQGGDGDTFEDLKVTNPSNGSTHSNFPITLIGIYTFSACCTHLKFDVTGGAAPNIEFDLFAESRP